MRNRVEANKNSLSRLGFTQKIYDLLTAERQVDYISAIETCMSNPEMAIEMNKFASDRSRELVETKQKLKDAEKANNHAKKFPTRGNNRGRARGRGRGNNRWRGNNNQTFNHQNYNQGYNSRGRSAYRGRGRGRGFYNNGNWGNSGQFNNQNQPQNGYNNQPQITSSSFNTPENFRGNTRGRGRGN